jgi:hypothetical protein
VVKVAVNRANEISTHRQSPFCGTDRSPQHDENASTIWTEQVLRWHFDVVKCDVRGTSRRRIRGLDRLGLDALTALNEENGEPRLETHGAQRHGIF